jgi:hypothetical protein
MIKTLLATLALALALLGAAPDTAQAAKPPNPPPSQTVSYSAAGVPLVDDSGVTRNFFVSYTYDPALQRTTCSYSVNGREVNNPEWFAKYRPTSLLVPEGVYREYDTTVAPSGADAIAFCVSRFELRTRYNPDPTI